ncbi:MAG: PIN domain-containing protein [Deltaproteobacteria bacterium]|nr:PIN domain-containing protein [Deltaproteobacteria bacterium]
MSARTFLDTNVLVKLHDTSTPEKQALAKALVAEERKTGGPTVSPIILAEVFHALTKTRVTKGRQLTPIFTRAEAEAAVRLHARLEVKPVTADIYLASLKYLQEHRKLGSWDALHLATAVAHGCDRLITWDTEFPVGKTIDGVRIEEP